MAAWNTWRSLADDLAAMLAMMGNVAGFWYCLPRSHMHMDRFCGVNGDERYSSQLCQGCCGGNVPEAALVIMTVCLVGGTRSWELPGGHGGLWLQQHLMH